MNTLKSRLQIRRDRREHFASFMSAAKKIFEQIAAKDHRSGDFSGKHPVKDAAI